MYSIDAMQDRMLSWLKNGNKAPDMPRVSKPDAFKIATSLPEKKIADGFHVSDELIRAAGVRPEDWDKPAYGSTGYWLAYRVGWLTDEEVAADKAAREARSIRARQTSHRPRHEDLNYPAPDQTDEYVPELHYGIVKDRRLRRNDMRVAMFLMRHAYQDCRNSRVIAITKSFIMEGLSISLSSVKRALKRLGQCGYIERNVVKSEITRMCKSMLIRLLKPLFPRHHHKRWPGKLDFSGGSRKSHKQRFQLLVKKSPDIVPAYIWRIRCDNGVWRSNMKTSPLFGCHSPTL